MTGLSPEQKRALALERERQRRASAAPSEQYGPFLSEFQPRADVRPGQNPDGSIKTQNRADELITGLAAGAMRGVAGLGALLVGEGTNARFVSDPVSGPDGAPMPGNTRLVPDPSVGTVRSGFDAVFTPEGMAYKAPGFGGDVAGAVGEFLPGAGLAAATGGMSAARAIGQYAVAPAVASELAGKVTEGTKAEPYARLAAAILAPGAVSLVESGIRTAISPHGGANPARIAMADDLAKEGVPTTAGQQTGSSQLRYYESNSPRMQHIFETQSEDFTRAAMKRIGTDGLATPENMSAAADRIGGVFDRVARNTTIHFDPQQGQAASSILAEFQSLTAKAARAPIFGKALKSIEAAAKSGAPLSAKRYQSYRTVIGKMVTSPDPAIREAARKTIGLMDDAMSSSLMAAGRAEDVAALATARQQWRDYLAISSAAKGAGEGAAMGVISPARLRSAVAAQGTQSYVKGQRDLGELARAGSAVMKPVPQSGTAPRQMAELARRFGPLMGGSAAGGGIGFAASGGNPAAAALGVAAGTAIPKATERFLTSPLGQRYLANQLAAPNMNGVRLNSLAGPAIMATRNN